MFTEFIAFFEIG